MYRIILVSFVTSCLPLTTVMPVNNDPYEIHKCLPTSRSDYVLDKDVNGVSLSESRWQWPPFPLSYISVRNCLSSFHDARYGTHPNWPSHGDPYFHV